MNKEKILKMINKRINYTEIEEAEYIDNYWENLTSEFTGTEDEIIDFLDSMDDNILGYASEIFDDIYDKLGESQTFADKLEELQRKRPNVNLGLF